MNRVKIRENTFKLLFCKEFHNVEDMQEQCRLYFEELNDGKNVVVDFDDEEEMLPKVNEEEVYVTDRVNDIISKIEEIDAKINEVSVGWNTDRMGKVELTIIRLAYYEMEYDEEVPKKVAIDQAVELAKKYGSDMSPSFVNGILAKLYQE